jgi:DNA (cytosine-5)-methyltransferase 1
MGATVLDLFSGAAGGWSLGMHRAGFRTVAACEAVDWRRAMFSANNPEAKVYDDVRTLSAARLLADIGSLPRVVVGSPPCQGISAANPRGCGIEDARSGLYFEAARIIREVRPRWFALENSDRLRTRGYDRIAECLEGDGYTCWPLVVGSGHAGASHIRKRSVVIGMDANADRIGGEAAGPIGSRGQRSSEAASGTHVAVDANADEDALWFERRGLGEAGSGETVRGLARIFRGPSGSEPLGRHLRAYDGLPAWLAELCREAFGDSVSPQISEAVGRAILRVEAALAAVHLRAAA